MTLVSEAAVRAVATELAARRGASAARDDDERAARAVLFVAAPLIAKEVQERCARELENKTVREDQLPTIGACAARIRALDFSQHGDGKG